MDGASASGIDLPPNKLSAYYKVRSIFPHLNVQVIKSIIINPNQYGIVDTGVESELIRTITEFLLDNGDEYVDYNAVSRTNNQWNLAKISSKEQTDRLIGIFPDADPEFLESFSNKNFSDPQKINTFIEENLDNKNYPTRQQFVRRKKMEKNFDKYFTNFDVKDFIKEYPDPVEYFEKNERVCEESQAIFTLLCRLFGNLDRDIIKKKYTACKYNPSLTAKNLVQEQSIILKKFTKDSIQLLGEQMQEFCFISNREIINQEIKKNEILQNSKEELLTCGTCFHQVPGTRCSSCDDGHIFCDLCISYAVKCKIADGIYTIQCFENCESSISQKTLQKVLDAKMYDILLEKQQEAELAAANIKNLESCPFCDFRSVAREEDKIFICLNEDCKIESCRNCKKANHLPYDCKDVLEMEYARLYIEEKMTKALVRNCYKCEREFLKVDGYCNRMVCDCGAVQCYICDKPVPPNDYKHFNGQGANNHHLCPLFSDDRFQEAKSVREVAEKTKQEILKKYPDFDSQIVDSLLPSLPSKTAGPHNNIPNADELPEHALNVAKATFITEQ